MWLCTIIRTHNEIAAIRLSATPRLRWRAGVCFVTSGHDDWTWRSTLSDGTEWTLAYLGGLLLSFGPELPSRRSIPSSTMPSRQPLSRIARNQALRFHDSHFQQETSLGFAHRPDQFGPGDQDVRQHTAPSRCATCKHG